jgi:hypothetical protein
VNCVCVFAYVWLRYEVMRCDNEINESAGNEIDVRHICNSDMDSRAFSQYYVLYDSKTKEAAAAAKPLAEWQKTHAATAEKLKAFLVTKAIDESKVGSCRSTPVTKTRPSF